MSTTEKANTADMVKDAIKTLGERGGSSLHNIKKYIEAVYQVDMRYRAPWIRKYLRTAVSNGGLVQTRGRGASGSFKLPPSQPPPTPPPPPPAPASSSRSTRGGPARRKASATSISTTKSERASKGARRGAEQR